MEALFIGLGIAAALGGPFVLIALALGLYERLTR